MLGPQISLDSIFFPIPSFMAKNTWIHIVQGVFFTGTPPKSSKYKKG